VIHLNQNVLAGAKENRAIILKCPDNIFFRILDMARTLPNTYVVFAKSSPQKLYVVEEAPMPQEVHGAMRYRFEIMGFVKDPDTFERDANAITSNGAYWVMARKIKAVEADLND
jgi:hypothetical protein